MKRLFLILFCASIALMISTTSFAEYVNGYLGSDGTYVPGYWRSDVDSTTSNKYGTKSNTNPYTQDSDAVNPWVATPKKQTSNYDYTPNTYDYTTKKTPVYEVPTYNKSNDNSLNYGAYYNLNSDKTKAQDQDKLRMSPKTGYGADKIILDNADTDSNKVFVEGYYRQDGTYVRGYYRSKKSDNDLSR